MEIDEEMMPDDSIVVADPNPDLIKSWDKVMNGGGNPDKPRMGWNFFYGETFKDHGFSKEWRAYRRTGLRNPRRIPMNPICSSPAPLP